MPGNYSLGKKSGCDFPLVKSSPGQKQSSHLCFKKTSFARKAVFLLQLNSDEPQLGSIRRSLGATHGEARDVNGGRSEIIDSGNFD